MGEERTPVRFIMCKEEDIQKMKSKIQCRNKQKIQLKKCQRKLKKNEINAEAERSEASEIKKEVVLVRATTSYVKRKYSE